MNAKEVYEKYKHLDKLLSDKEWLGEEIRAQMLYDFWQAIKTEASKPRQEMCSKKSKPETT